MLKTPLFKGAEWGCGRSDNDTAAIPFRLSSHTDIMSPSFEYGNSNFFDVLKRKYPHLMPDSSHLADYVGSLVSQTHWEPKVPIGTTVLAMKYADGVFIVGDRMAVEGYQVGERRIEKVFITDEYSAVAIAGAAGPCMEMVRIFQLQLEYHEKQEGMTLSLEGKANFLSSLVRSNLSAALMGLIVVPIFAGYDVRCKEGRIFKYDVTGGRFEEKDYYATGSGGKDARGTLKKRYRPGMSREEGLKAVLEAIWDAADEDLPTGGPDFIRDIYPTAKIITSSGAADVPEEEVKQFYESLIQTLKEQS